VAPGVCQWSVVRFSWSRSLSSLKIHILDTIQLGRPGIIAATALETNDGIVLFDTGAESTYNNIVAALQKIGAAANEVKHVFLSHIHFDHAGAAWRFAELGATIYVHPRGAQHLVDPAKLIASATRIFGDDLQRLWGRVAPVPQERVRILEDNNVVPVTPFEIRAIATPGHANHHHVYHWEDNVFGGDIGGVRLAHGSPIPPFVPPELHIESWHESIAKIRELNPTNLYLPHFGLVKGSVTAHLDALDERVTRWSQWFHAKISAGVREQDLVPAFAKVEHDDLIADGATEELAQDYETADPSHMAIPAAIRYWHKYHGISGRGD
jgi:glyoxylase-like metal-dependent hydrolase (beta-lactamase superfamily II)